MTNEKAIEILKELWRYSNTDKYSESEIRKAINIAINAVEAVDYDCADCKWYLEVKKNEMSKEDRQVTNGDLIPRQAVITMLNKIENAVEDGDGFQFNEWIEYAKDIPSAEKTANKININEYVKVKLTDYGKEIFYHQYDEINSFYKCEKIKPHYPKVDKEGYASFQLWYFMNLYGRYIDMGMQNVIEPLEIVFESAEKTAEWVIYPDSIQCSNCETFYQKIRIDQKHYCPNCGARMKESEETK